MFKIDVTYNKKKTVCLGVSVNDCISNLRAWLKSSFDEDHYLTYCPADMKVYTDMHQHACLGKIIQGKITLLDKQVLVKAWFDHKPFAATIIKEARDSNNKRTFLVAPEKGSAVWRKLNEFVLIDNKDK